MDELVRIGGMSQRLEKGAGILEPVAQYRLDALDEGSMGRFNRVFTIENAQKSPRFCPVPPPIAADRATGDDFWVIFIARITRPSLRGEAPTGNGKKITQKS
jgi:hypothetical protein